MGYPAQVIAPIETPYTLIDAESRTRFEVGAEGPLRGNGPLTGYAYMFLTRPHFLDEHVYLRALIAPVYATGELICDHWPTTHSALSLGLGGGLAGVGANLSVALTKRITLVAGYGYGIDAPRGRGFGGHEVSTLFEFKY